MANLKELRKRISTVKSTEKITSAMKMISASRLRRSQQLLSKHNQYHNELLQISYGILKSLEERAKEAEREFVLPKFLQVSETPRKYLLLAIASDKGLCGGYNVNVARETIKRIKELEGKDVKVFCIGRKIRDILKRNYSDFIIGNLEDVAAKSFTYDENMDVYHKIKTIMRDNSFDVCEAIYSKFHTALNREVICDKLYPISFNLENIKTNEFPTFEYEPDILRVLEDTVKMLKKSLMFDCLLNSQASEHGARMISMDNATANAKDMISKLTLKYNRIRQSVITTELIEVISGAEAM